MLSNAIEAYKTVLKKPEFLEKENAILEEKRQELLKMEHVIFPNENIILNSNQEQEKQITEIAELQAKLDIYAYTHRKDIDKLRNRIAQIYEIENKSECREELLNEIENIKIRYKVFGRYVEDPAWKELYSTKFEVLMSDINTRTESPLEYIQIDFNEIQHFKRIIESKISQIITAQNPELENTFGKEGIPEAVKIIINILKNEQEPFVIEGILLDRDALALILAFDMPNGFEKMTVDKLSVEDIDTPIYKWAQLIPIKTIWQLTMPEYKHYIPKYIHISNSKYVRLYDIHNEYLRKMQNKEKQEEKDNYKKIHRVPEGLVWMGHDDTSILGDYKMEYDEIIFPSTLKGIGRGVINGTGVYEIKFNEGLEVIGEGAFKKCPNLGRNINMKMPQSLKIIGREAFCECYNMAPLILNEGLEEIGDYAFYYSNSDEAFSPATIIILPSTVRKVGRNIVQIYGDSKPSLGVRNLGFKNYKGQDIPDELFKTWYTPAHAIRETYASFDYIGYSLEETDLENIYLFEGDSLVPYLRIDPKELFGCNRSQKLKMAVEKLKENER